MNRRLPQTTNFTDVVSDDGSLANTELAIEQFTSCYYVCSQDTAVPCQLLLQNFNICLPMQTAGAAYIAITQQLLTWRRSN